jgi:hypothetical protein
MRRRQQQVWATKRQKHTTGGIPRWSPTLVLVARFSAYVWQSGRDAQFSLTYGRMYRDFQYVVSVAKIVRDLRLVHFTDGHLTSPFLAPGKQDTHPLPSPAAHSTPQSCSPPRAPISQTRAQPFSAGYSPRTLPAGKSRF